MDGLLKLVVFFIFFLGIALLVYRSYTWMNGRIQGSRNGWELLGYCLLMIGFNGAVFFAGVFAFVKCYLLLSEI